jgi:hypothetical protein
VGIVSNLGAAVTVFIVILLAIIMMQRTNRGPGPRRP